MKLMRLAPGSLLLLALCATTSPAQKQRVPANGSDTAVTPSNLFPAPKQRTFVSSSGSDSDPCTLAAPCRTFSEAILQTNAGGAVVVLDSAGYGAFSVSQSISIISAPGAYAGIFAPAGNGIEINAGPGDVVNLQGLTITSNSGGASGVAFNSGGTLRVEGCVVRGFSSSSGVGIKFGGAGNLVIKDTEITDCGEGVQVIPSSVTARAAMDHITVDRCQVGVSIEATGTGSFAAGGIALAAIRDSSILGGRPDSSVGIRVASFSAGANAFLDVERCLIANGGTGLLTQAATLGFPVLSAMSISNCLISHNSSAGFAVGSGTTIFSRGNNTIIGNGSNSGSLTPFSAQ